MRTVLIAICSCVILFVGIARASADTLPDAHPNQDSIIAKYLQRGAWKHSYYTKEWQDFIDAGLKEDSTVAYLWQQKAMPYFKEKKYEIAMPYLDKAVQYDTFWLDYRAFMKTIFCRTYRSALADLNECKKLRGDAGVMDHTYDFYIGLCYLQLNKFDSALIVLKNETDTTNPNLKNNMAHFHFLDLFYLGIAYYETQNYDDAIRAFDRSIAKCPNFGDAEYYKGMCLREKGETAESNALFAEAKQDYKKGNTINEDNAIYELYPYQLSAAKYGTQ